MYAGDLCAELREADQERTCSFPPKCLAQEKMAELFSPEQFPLVLKAGMCSDPGSSCGH